eukprot:5059175-Pyramimonas_sp.AAC.1
MGSLNSGAKPDVKEFMVTGRCSFSFKWRVVGHHDRLDVGEIMCLEGCEEAINARLSVVRVAAVGGGWRADLDQRSEELLPEGGLELASFVSRHFDRT